MHYYCVMSCGVWMGMSEFGCINFCLDSTVFLKICSHSHHLLFCFVTGIATERGNTSCCEPSEWGSNGVKIGFHPSKSQPLEVPLERPVQWEWGKTRLLSVKSQ